MLLNLKEFIDTSSSLANPHRGKVVDNNDPLKLGRVKCTIAGIFQGATANLPWIHPLGPTLFGGTSSSGLVSVPEIGSELVIEFPYDDIYFPVYTGIWANTGIKVTDFDGEYLDILGLKVGGLKISYNKSSQLFKIDHPSGVTISVTQTGDMNIENVNNLNAQANNINANVAQNLVAQIGVQADITVPVANVNAATGVNMTTPLLNVSGLISCAGIGAGAPPVAGKGVFQGDVETTGDVKSSGTTLNTVKTVFNAHTHPENGMGGGVTSPTTSPL